MKEGGNSRKLRNAEQQTEVRSSGFEVLTRYLSTSSTDWLHDLEQMNSSKMKGFS